MAYQLLPHLPYQPAIIKRFTAAVPPFIFLINQPNHTLRTYLIGRTINQPSIQ